MMRTTLTIDDDVLFAVRAKAHFENRAIGDVLSELARSALGKSSTSQTRNGLPILQRSKTGAIVTLDIVNALRDETPE